MRRLVALGPTGAVALLILAGVLPANGASAIGRGASALWAEAPSCLVCHGRPEIRDVAPPGQGESLYVRADDLAGSAHAAFTCTSCHPELTSVLHGDMQNELAQARASCPRCHPDESRAYLAGAHAGTAAGGASQPSCVTCHGAHRVNRADSQAFEEAANRQCSQCHTEMGERFFGGNPFGMETHLGRDDVATCVDCHRSHLVLPTSDPRSPVNPANILETCRKCHRSAPPNFADIQIHVAAGPLPSDPRLRAVTLYMILILVGTFGFFGAHTVLGIRHEWRANRRREEERT